MYVMRVKKAINFNNFEFHFFVTFNIISLNCFAINEINTKMKMMTHDEIKHQVVIPRVNLKD